MLTGMQFVEDRYSWQEMQRRRRRSLWRRHLVWLRQFPPITWLIIIIGEIALAYFSLLFGMFVGLIIRFAVFS
jgi:hypothetical protein